MRAPHFPVRRTKTRTYALFKLKTQNSRLITCLSKNPLLLPRRRQQQDRTSKLYKSSTQNPSSSSPPPQKKRKLIRWFWLPFRNLFNSLSAVSLQFQTTIQLQRERDNEKPRKREEKWQFQEWAWQLLPFSSSSPLLCLLQFKPRSWLLLLLLHPLVMGRRLTKGLLMC
ncbi:hypothetical protein LINPERHAP1_LOCUS14406 [Linum perenne]